MQVKRELIQCLGLMGLLITLLATVAFQGQKEKSCKKTIIPTGKSCQCPPLKGKGSHKHFITNGILHVAA